MSRVSIPNGTVTHVWSDNADDFDHAQLAVNWDALDEAQVPLGGVIMWWRATAGRPNVPWSTGSVWQPCDGRTILSANHDLGGGDLVLPDLRNYAALGSTIPGEGGYPGDGNAGTAGSNTAANAPGVRGAVGSNVDRTVPSHHHIHQHTHLLNEGAATSDDVGVAMQDDAGDPYYFNTDSAGSGINAARLNHTHHLLSQYVSGVHKPSQLNKRTKDLSAGQRADAAQAQIQTSTQILKTGGTDDVPTPAIGPGDALTVAAQPRSYGMVFLMKVRVTPR